MLVDILSDITLNKIGVEIGGPSSTGDILYQNATTIDNVIFSKNTIWSNHTNEYNYYHNKKVLIDGLLCKKSAFEMLKGVNKNFDSEKLEK